MAVAVAVCMMGMIVPVLVQAEEFSIPATFIRNIEMPGVSDFILRPKAVRYDRFNDELYVADSGHNRIVVYSVVGSYKFEFGLGDQLTSPIDVACDPEGYIYVLGSNIGGRGIHRFDFDGYYLGVIELPAAIEGISLDLRSLGCADDGRLFALDHGGQRVVVIDHVQGVTNWFPAAVPAQVDLEQVKETAGEESLDRIVLGRLSVVDDGLLIPMANLGFVLHLGLEGEMLGVIGHFGSKPASLNFPVAAEKSKDGHYLVLDQGRFCVVNYNPDGEPIGEFGGKGHSPGWFITPSLLAVPSMTEVIVGQIFENKIQVCALPDFARGGSQSGTEGDVWDLEAKNLEVPAGPVFRKRSSLRPPRVNSPNQREPKGSHHTDSHLEVSE